MSKLLVIGTGPLYTPDIKIFCAQSMRTWHLTEALHKAGHIVDLFVTQTDGNEIPPELQGQIAQARKETFNYGIIHSFDPAIVQPILQQILDDNDYDAIVSINVNVGAIVSQLKTTLPIWADLGGHMMGEAQAKCGVEGSDDLLLHFWKRQRAVLRRADRISTTGQKQMYAVIGELGTLGRLGRKNAAHSFVSVMPEAADSMFLEVTQPIVEKKYRGSLFPDDTFAVLWSGGYNTWTDVHALAAALTLAMEQVPRLRFISTGGAIPGHNEGTYPEFVNLMKRSGFDDRCHFLGWIEGHEIPQLFAECDLGLNLDGMNYETLLGGRNRLTSMMAAGLPVLTTIGTEFSEIIADNRLGYTVRIGKIQEYADAMIRASRISPERRQLGQRARTYMKEHYLPETITKPLLRWATEPTMAPDNLAKLESHPQATRLRDVAQNPLEEEAMALEEGVVKDNEWFQQEIARLESENAQMKGSRFFKMREKLHNIKNPGRK